MNELPASAITKTATSIPFHEIPGDQSASFFMRLIFISHKIKGNEHAGTDTEYTIYCITDAHKHTELTGLKCFDKLNDLSVQPVHKGIMYRKRRLSQEQH
ncbi:hypothetical protein SAMN04488122_3894 [Chitinophaga arvensicola]|uniref:Uncharacterized protein n=1 Tax=Chitinophaga arvensicola TaxID=29529 RepID=A0A1I0S5U3_9BACT|nr:hypothetical protein SAMN04488122_3894 [Chitinophaga arvensicola]